ncbi:hypothetical protein K7X08_008404 [Anisodus acutangulus]|uniref:Uncharacterized protein n=1 Tax=Anisodus acutangulus TaxID=402998 RepID=A0A9Q1MTM0_9SOLA|nr:hypothetical protein K7X08_008404 [Anisodus acutangulus]
MILVTQYLRTYLVYMLLSWSKLAQVFFQTHYSDGERKGRSIVISITSSEYASLIRLASIAEMTGENVMGSKFGGGLSKADEYRLLHRNEHLFVLTFLLHGGELHNGRGFCFCVKPQKVISHLNTSVQCRLIKREENEIKDESTLPFQRSNDIMLSTVDRICAFFMKIIGAYLQAKFFSSVFTIGLRRSILDCTLVRLIMEWMDKRESKHLRSALELLLC